MEQLKEFLWKGTPASLIRISGDDSLDYLQSQLSNKIEGRIRTCSYALWLNRKGKILADSYAFSTASDEFYLLSYHINADKLVPIIEANIIADDVEIEDITEDYILYSLFGFSEAQLEMPENGYSGNFSEKVYFRGNRGENCSYEIIVKKDSKSDAQLNEIENKIGSIDLDGSSLEQMRILGGIAKVGTDATDNDLPQEAGLNHAVNYNKGCYLGQEVMARIHAQGKVNRSLYKVELQNLNTLNCPAKIIDKDSGKTAGEITSITQWDNNIVGLCILKDKYDLNTLILEEQPDTPLRIDSV